MLQKLHRTLYFVCIVTAVFCRSPLSESEILKEGLEKKKIIMRILIVIISILLCSLLFLCKEFAKTLAPDEIEVVMSVSSDSSSSPSVIVVNNNRPHDDGINPCQQKEDVKMGKDDTTTELDQTRGKQPINFSKQTVTSTLFELDTKLLQPETSEHCQVRIVEFINKKSYSTEVQNSRQGRKLLQKKTLASMGITWAKKQTSRVGVQVL